MKQELSKMDTEEFIVTIYNVEKLGFSPYFELNKQFQSKYHFETYAQLISNIRESVSKYVNDADETLWLVAYKNGIQIKICLCVFGVFIGMVGTFLLPLLYIADMIGFVSIVFGTSICGIALSICGIFYYHNKSNDFIKRYKESIFYILDNGLKQLNILYSNKAIFQITHIISTKSRCSFTVDLDINFRIILLCDNVDKQCLNINNGQKQSIQSIQSTKRIENKNEKTRRDQIIQEQNPSDLAMSVEKFSFSEINEEKCIEMEIESHGLTPYKEENKDEEKYIEVTVPKQNVQQINMNSIDLIRALNTFHSYQVLENIVDLADIHRGDSHYNLGRIIGKYFDNIFHDNSIVVIVSDMDKQPQLSYVSKPDFERKIKNLNGLDVLIYRAIDYIQLNVHSQHELSSEFKQIVTSLSNVYTNTARIALELDNMYGAGCHVARAQHANYDIFCSYSHGLIARCLCDNGVYIIAWRR